VSGWATTAVLVLELGDDGGPDEYGHQEHGHSYGGAEDDPLAPAVPPLERLAHLDIPIYVVAPPGHGALLWGNVSSAFRLCVGLLGNLLARTVYAPSVL